MSATDQIRYTAPTPSRGQAPSHSPPDVRYRPGLSLARSLGWFSVGLGLAELLAPKAVARLTGADSPRLLQAHGLREIACGVAILNSTQPSYGLWGRVAGDAIDLATLAPAVFSGDGRGRRALVSAAAVAGVTALDVAAGVGMTVGEAVQP